MKRLLVTVMLLMMSSLVTADEIVHLICTFKYGEIEVKVNYTKETANDTPAVITDDEIFWRHGKSKDSMALINRYTGIMTMGDGRKEFTGMCNQAAKE